MNLTEHTQQRILTYCSDRCINPDNLVDILENSKLDPMIQGYNNEYVILDNLNNCQELQDRGFRFSKGKNGEDIFVSFKDDVQKYAECKLPATLQYKQERSTFLKRSGKKIVFEDGNLLIKIKCMKSRTKGDEKAAQISKKINKSVGSIKIHNDQYIKEDFHFLFITLGPILSQLPIVKVTKRRKSEIISENEFYDILGSMKVTDPKRVYNKMYYKLSDELVSTKYNPTCQRRKCKSKNCGFIPNYPELVLSVDGGKSVNGWRKCWK